MRALKCKIDIEFRHYVRFQVYKLPVRSENRVGGGCILSFSSSRPLCECNSQWQTTVFGEELFQLQGYDPLFKKVF